MIIINFNKSPKSISIKYEYASTKKQKSEVKSRTEPVVAGFRSVCGGVMTEQILLEKFALLHLWIENNDDEEDKAEKPNFFCRD